MYSVKLGEYPLYDLRDPVYVLGNPVLDLKVNKVGGFTFSIFPEHPYYDRIEKLASVIDVLKDGRTIFKGRVISDEQGLYLEKKVECEGPLAYLNDSIVRPYTFTGTPAAHFTALIEGHNAQVAEAQRLKVGTITVTDANDYISRSSVDYASTWDVLNEDLIDKVGGYLRVRYESDGVYVDYLADFSDTATQEIQAGENLLDILIKNDASDVYTAVLPLGAKTDDVRLTIESVNDGLDYLVNTEAYERYGFICAPVESTTWDDVTIAANLKRKGTEYLNNQAVMLKSSVEAKVVDLNIVDEDIERLFIYEYVKLKALGLDVTFLLSEINIPLASPENMTVTLGKETNSLTGLKASGGQGTQGAPGAPGVSSYLHIKYSDDGGLTFSEGTGRYRGELVSNIAEPSDDPTAYKWYDMALVVDEELNVIRDEVTQTRTLVTETQDAVIREVGENYVSKGVYDTFTSDVSTQFAQTAEDFEFTFNNISSLITELDGDTQQQFQEISKYIRFENGNIVLGETGNEITLRIENDRISFIQNNNEVAYFSNNKLTVTDGHFLSSLTIGNFALKPRANGNLSLVYTGGAS